MENKALEIVSTYIKEHLDRSDATPEFDVYTVWKCKALQNWKFLISSSLYDGMYYELTYNGDKHEWYLDAYKKFENRCIPAVVMKDRIAEIWKQNIWQEGETACHQRSMSALRANTNGLKQRWMDEIPCVRFLSESWNTSESY